ncbi:MAG TPA: SpoIIE family protein phosphatase [Spirochaetota bacterium]|jgi:serine phosphatase RsbU (regulator of sigma subunit)|nr:MAG: Phosphoserine phosphatase RsbU [Spirochaetes bacterium ADurb.Bin133]HNZ25673.1 SpoIIE family protein phosphatase [Spirochaetota bacterium]HOF00149.1 SpoIIE family protein phosphatase [Spirochaetota bacterium]HOS32136.1 SpoIIE family protein phosphatase [Spirochaetota bacterium]HOS54588.1 SpoIIE family protein phosphatase [Spirochaetota bacterium]
MSDSKKTKKGFWSYLKIRSKLIFIILPTAIIPLVVVVSFTSWRLYNHLENQGRESYSTLIQQVSKNVEFLYNQNARTLSNMLDIPALVEGFRVAEYKSAQDEIDIGQMMIGNVTTRGGLRNTFEEKIEGMLYVVELDKKSINDKTDYKQHLLIDNQIRLDIDLLLKDPLFLKLKSDNKVKLVFGRLTEGIITGIYADSPVMIYPYYAVPPEKETDTFTKFLLVALKPGFLSSFYNEIESLNFGTLYVLDSFNNVMSFNHPLEEEDFVFDNEKKTYIFDKETEKSIIDYEKDEKVDLMNFDDYKMLNVDSAILQTPQVNELLTKMAEGDMDVFYEKNIVTHNNEKYLTVLGFGEDSQTKYVYFHPVKQFQKPIVAVVRIIVLFSGIMILLIVLISYMFSKTFTRPINTLVSATHVVAQGNYNHFIESKYNDEIGILSENFNQMIKNIKAYQDRLLSAEREKSELELASKIQTCLLPAIPQREHYDITATMIPAAEVGGDYYDLIGETNGRIWFGIGDVSGHGLTSGLIMMMAQTAFNTILLNDPTISSDKLVAQVNKVMYQNIKQRLGEDHFMTISFMVANPDGTVQLSGCHLDVLIYRSKTKKVERLETNGVWLGLIPDIEKSTVESSFKLEQGDLFFLYTDGLIECTNAKDEQYDMERLIKKLEEIGDKPVKDIEEEIINDVFHFLKEQKDDITFVVARKK